MSDVRNYGCDACWPAVANAAWEAQGRHERIAELVDESHFIVSLHRCTECGQVFLSVISELIDWKDGDDSQGWMLMPLEISELDELKATVPEQIERRIYRIGEHRRSLWRVRPRGSTAGCSWGRGLIAFPHD